jgi:hypothetical protein
MMKKIYNEKPLFQIPTLLLNKISLVLVLRAIKIFHDKQDPRSERGDEEKNET